MSVSPKSTPLGASRQLELMRAATRLEYRQTDQGPLHAHVFAPDGHRGMTDGGAIVFFHGGFWDHPMAAQFAPQCLHYASLGITAITIETRVSGTHGTGPMEALDDMRACLQWLAASSDLRIDPQRVVLGGSSGGAWLALQAVLPKKDRPRWTPAGVVLFSPLLDTTRGAVAQRFPDAQVARELSPLRQIRRRLPPMLICQGTADRVTPHADALRFAKAMKWRFNRLECVEFENAQHAFFNFNVSQLHYELSLNAADRFLVDLGLLTADPRPA